jgi:endonuclease-3
LKKNIENAALEATLIGNAPSFDMHGDTAASGEATRAAPPVVEVAKILVRHYGTWPDESDGPVIDQLVWFLLSTRTTVENCEAAYTALRRDFPDWDGVVTAGEEELYAPLRLAGLYRTRAKNLHAALTSIHERFGVVSLEALRSWPDHECESFLLNLPGVGLKVARCVMSFGLARRVLAVDTHIWRISRRLGWHNFPGDAPSRRGADFLNARMPAGLDVLSLHVNLIHLGRTLCTSGTVDCDVCPLDVLCPMAGMFSASNLVLNLKHEREVERISL